MPSKRALSALLIGLVVVTVKWTPTAGAVLPEPGSPLALRQHPRMLLTSSNLPAVRARLGSGGADHAHFKTWVSWADSVYATAASSAPHELPLHCWNFAFLYATHGAAGVSYGHTQSEYGAKTREILFRLMTGNETPSTYEWWGVALAYDWINSVLSANDKAQLVAWFKKAPTVNDPSPFNSQLVAARMMRLMFGIAAAYDGIDDAWALDWAGKHDEFFDGMATGVTQAESAVVGEDGGASQGDSYGLVYTAPAVVMAEEAWRTANGVALSHYASPGRSFLRRLPQHVAYSTLPWAVSTSSAPGGRRYVLWKSQYMYANKELADVRYTIWLSALSNLLQSADPDMASLAQWLIENRTGAIGTSGVSHLYAAWKFALGGVPAPPKSPVDLGLPVSRQFRDGRFVFRTGWTDVTDTYVTLTAAEWLRDPYGTSPNYPGGFTIDRKGPQVIRQGGISGHDPGHFSAGPNNILLFVDRTITKPTGNYDDGGGQRQLSGPMTGAASFVPDGPADLRDEVRFAPADLQAGRDVDYVLTDVTRAYNSTRYHDTYNAAKTSEVVRQMVFFRPASASESSRVVIFDRATSTDTKYEKNWLFHTSGEPMVNGTQTAGQPVRNGSGLGKWSYSGATRIRATNTVNGSNGATFLTPLLPADRLIVKVGGPNVARQSWQTDSHEFESPWGEIQPYAPPVDNDTEQYVGRYRIEIIPRAPALRDVFLNVIEVTDSEVQTPSATVLLTSVGVVAARVGNRIAVFNGASGDVANGELTIDQAGSYGIHFADLSPSGEYQLTIGGAVTTQAASSAGTIYLQQNLAAGTKVLLRATGNRAALRAPSAPFNVRIVR